MKCRAVCRITIFKGRFGDAEDVFKSDPHDFEIGSELAAKATATRWANTIPEMQDIEGTALLKVKGELPDWWAEHQDYTSKLRWEAWGNVKRDTYQKNPEFIYAETNRMSDVEFVTLDTKSASAEVRAYIQLAWLEPQEDS